MRPGIGVHSQLCVTCRHMVSGREWHVMSESIWQRVRHVRLIAAHHLAPGSEVTETQNRPFGRVGVDLIGPLPLSVSGHRYVLTAVCHLTGWAEAVPISDKRAAMVWDAMELEIFSRWDYPQEIVSDNGMEFVSDDTRTLFRAHGIRHLRTSPLHPQSNGVIECFNGSLKATLTKLVNNQPGEWETLLSRAMWAYRRSPKEGRGGG